MLRLTKFLRLSGSERWLLTKAVVLLGIARIALLMIPFRRLAPFLGTHMAESSEKDEPEHKDIAERVSWAVQTASRHIPWECKCLTQAIAGKGMLRLRGISSTLYLGVNKDEDEKLKAHAWLRSGDMTVIGADCMDQFKVISTFSEEKY